jgi:hypothetical protein
LLTPKKKLLTQFQKKKKMTVLKGTIAKAKKRREKISFLKTEKNSFLAFWKNLRRRSFFLRSFVVSG